MAKSSSIAVARWRWSERGGPARLVRELGTRGLSHIHIPDLDVRSADVRSMFVRLFGPDRGLLRSARLFIHPEPGETIVVRSNLGVQPHIDDDEFMPANVQILCCVRPSRRGGENTYVDSWSLLDRIEREDRELFHALFEVPRVFRYVDMTPVRATFSLRYGNLIYSHSPEGSDDEIGRRLAVWIERAPTYEVRLEPGDICVINHQRMMHGRHAFRGPREFVRLQYWFSKAFPGRPEYVARARRFARKLARHNPSGPTWAREWLQPSEHSTDGVSRAAAVMAYIAGDDIEEVCRRFRVRSYELERWTSRVLSVATETLGGRDAEQSASRAAIRRQVLGAIDGLVGASTRRRHRR